MAIQLIEAALDIWPLFQAANCTLHVIHRALGAVLSSSDRVT